MDIFGPILWVVFDLIIINFNRNLYRGFLLLLFCFFTYCSIYTGVHIRMKARKLFFILFLIIGEVITVR